ncbi:MAG: shikimate dehydrogenase [Polaribacter sp.]|nr:shikimate dehydrogenase [Polaribacter sp.]
MKTQESVIKKHIFGLLGKNISYSFSSGYFREKFLALELVNYEYHNFDIQKIEDFRSLLLANEQSLKGLNVTIPYKQAILPYLDEIDKNALQIGAVNTIKITKDGSLKGYNTDAYGFQKSLEPLLKSQHTNALIFGTGGAAKAIAFVLQTLNIDFLYVSRNPKNEKEISYKELNETVLKRHQLLVNCTPLGTFPETEKSPNIPYQFIGKEHVLYDLIYNPSVTTFLANGKKQGARIKNGLEMLQLQAEKSWQIWNL